MLRTRGRPSPLPQLWTMDMSSKYILLTPSLISAILCANLNWLFFETLFRSYRGIMHCLLFLPISPTGLNPIRFHLGDKGKVRYTIFSHRWKKFNKRNSIIIPSRTDTTMPFRFVYRTADISALSRSLDSAEIHISCSVH